MALLQQGLGLRSLRLRVSKAGRTRYIPLNSMFLVIGPPRRDWKLSNFAQGFHGLEVKGLVLSGVRVYKGDWIERVFRYEVHGSKFEVLGYRGSVDPKHTHTLKPYFG